VLIGVTVVTADGAVVRGGGKVVKNVAGYDLPKLFVGSFGTLGVIVEATVSLPPAAATLAVGFDGLGDQVDWQVAELASLVVPCGGAKPVALPPPTWERLASAARDA